MARVPYVTKDTAPPKVADILAKMEAAGQQMLNIYGALGHCEDIAAAFIRMGNKIMYQGSLPPSLRELAILLVGHRAQAPYEFTKHTTIGLESGLSQAQIDALGAWRASPAYDDEERAVLAYTDEVSSGYRAQDTTFKALEGFLSTEQIVELTVTIGYYEMVCRILEALQIELEDAEFKPLGRLA